jgi:hypothetical protein
VDEEVDNFGPSRGHGRHAFRWCLDKAAGLLPIGDPILYRVFVQRASRLAFPVRAKNGRFGVDSVSARLWVGRWPLTQSRSSAFANS